MAKTNAEYQKAHRKRQPARINTQVTKQAKDQLKCLARHYAVSQKEALERALEDAVRRLKEDGEGYNGALRSKASDMSTTAAERARALWEACGEDLKKAQAVLLKRLKEESPGFKTTKRPKKGEQYYVEYCEYDAVRNKLNDLDHEAKAKTEQS